MSEKLGATAVTEPYPIQCFNCRSEYDAAEAIWCSCDPQRPTKVCPFCLGCFCPAGQEFKESFWRDSPAVLREQIETLSQSRMLIGDMLVRSGIISTEQLLEALNRQKVEHRRIGEILVDSGALPAERLESFLQSQHAAAAVAVTRARVDAMMLRRLGVERCLRERILPLEPEKFRDRQIMTLVMADPSDTACQARVMQATGFQIIPGVAPADAILSVIRSLYPEGSQPSVELRRDAMREVPAVCARLVERGVSGRASHLQIRQVGAEPQVFLRIDGALYRDRAGGPEESQEALAGFAGLADAGLGSGGGSGVARLPITIGGAPYYVLVRRSGEAPGDISAKLLDPASFPPHLEDLSFSPTAREHLRAALDRSTGLIVVSSPPFSGSTSTTYALALEVIGHGRSVALVESPRAVVVPGAIQEEHFPDLPGSFEGALSRARDSAADVVVITSARGFGWSTVAATLPERKLVILRMESRSLPEAIRRLADGGYPARALAERPTLVFHQRLLRRLCQDCRLRQAATPAVTTALRLTPTEASGFTVWGAKGCARCGPAPGYRGRTPLSQTLRPDWEVAEAILRRDAAILLAACRVAGMSNMRAEALAALSAGLSTPEEVNRLTRAPAAPLTLAK